MTRFPLLALVGALLATSGAAKVEIVAPSEVLHDTDVTVQVTKLEPNATIELRAEFVTRGGSIWRSVATFTADAHGVVDPAVMAPASGSWHDVDAHAFLWSMEKTKEIPSTTSVLDNDDRSIVTVAVLQQGTELARKQIVLVKRATGISTTEIRGPLVGTFFVPYGKRSLPAVIVLGGSEGGVNRDMAALIASHGFATLALAYFGIEPLPDLLDRIPVETVDRAVAWLREQPAIDGSRIGVLGGSKGAELALVAAARNPAIHAVVAYAPSSVVFQSITYGKGGLTSSWTAGGKELPFAPYVTNDAFEKSHRLIDLYVPSLAAAPAAAAIPVEAIHGPILLIAGRDDALWPSAAMAEQLVERAKEKHFPFTITSLTLANRRALVRRARADRRRVPQLPRKRTLAVGRGAAGG